MRYKKAPILEAVLEFRWSREKSLDQLEQLLSGAEFERFEKPKPRIHVGASINLDAGEVSHNQTQIGFEVSTRDGSELVFLEEKKFSFVQKAPYDRWEHFSGQALSLLAHVVHVLEIEAFERIGLRFVNRIDVPDPEGKGINTDDYVTVSFDGPRKDRGIIEEFQMRVVKPSERQGLHYALVLATTTAPIPGFSSILLDIDVFTRGSVVSSGKELDALLGEMRLEKNNIFEECLTDRARKLFGGVEE